MDFLSISDLDGATLEALALRSITLAAQWQDRSMPQTLHGARIGWIEELPGWRNPTALALGALSMGATCVRVEARLNGAEPVADLAGYMDNWFDLLGIRTPSLAQLRRFADHADAAVLNLRTQDDHPCEILGDLAYVLAHRGAWDGLRVAMVGPAGNIAQSWLEAAQVLPIHVAHVCLPQHAFPKDAYHGRATLSLNLADAETADVIVTDCWPGDMAPDENAQLLRLQISAACLDRCRPGVVFLPCPPVTRGQEVSDDAMRHGSCAAARAKAYLLHVQNAVMERALGRHPSDG